MSHIVCATDFSPHADKALLTAVEMAKSQGASLTLLHVVAPHTPLLPGEKPKDSAGLSDHDLAERLRAYMKEHYAARLEGLDWRISLRRGHSSEEILSFLREKKADLVVMGGQGLSGMGLVLFGSVAERVVRRAPCSVLVVR